MATTTSTDTTENGLSKYHTVTICADLPKIEQNYTIGRREDLPPNNYWLNKMDQNADRKSFKIQHVVANGPYTSPIEAHAIFSAFLFAYNSHEDIVLSPDDIWLMICIYFSQYVNDNAEQLRNLLVDHDGRKRLTIVQTGTMKPDWDDFLERMRTEIGRNVKHGVTDLLTSNFSTTTKIESFLSCVAVMDTFQKYFEYECYTTRCGIRKVHFMGVLDDWKMLHRKTEELRKFTLPNQNSFSNYIDGLLPIIDQFIETYQGRVDSDFWNKVMDIEHVGGGRSGRSPGTYISGWFLQLCYELHDRRSCHIKQIKLNSFKVPVEVNNEWTNESKTCYIVGGFHGVESADGRHKPVMSLAIVDDTSTIKPLKEN